MIHSVRNWGFQAKIIGDFRQILGHFPGQPYIGASRGLPEREAILTASFGSPFVLDLLSSERTRLAALPFAEFRIQPFSAEFGHELPEDCTTPVWTPQKKFSLRGWLPFAVTMLLSGSPSYLDSKELRRCLESGLDDDLKSRVRPECADEISELAKWIQNIRDISAERKR